LQVLKSVSQSLLQQSLFLEHLPMNLTQPPPPLLELEPPEDEELPPLEEPPELEPPLDEPPEDVELPPLDEPPELVEEPPLLELVPPPFSHIFHFSGMQYWPWLPFLAWMCRHLMVPDVPHTWPSFLPTLWQGMTQKQSPLSLKLIQEPVGQLVGGFLLHLRM